VGAGVGVAVGAGVINAHIWLRTFNSCNLRPLD
jgi:hypothetical protein